MRPIANLFLLSGVKVNGNDVNHNMVHRMLLSEKYYDMVVLQKTFTSSYLSKKVKINKGELDKYVYSDSHPKVINPNVREIVENRRKSLRAGNQPKRGSDHTFRSSTARNAEKGRVSMA